MAGSERPSVDTLRLELRNWLALAEKCCRELAEVRAGAAWKYMKCKEDNHVVVDGAIHLRCPLLPKQIYLERGAYLRAAALFAESDCPASQVMAAFYRSVVWAGRQEPRL